MVRLRPLTVDDHAYVVSCIDEWRGGRPMAAMPASAAGCTRRSPANTGSIAFHTRMGFTSRVVEGYDGLGVDRVVFARPL